MSEPVRARRLSDEEGRLLQQIVRRGKHGSVRVRRAMIIMASASGTPVARLHFPDCGSPGRQAAATQPSPHRRQIFTHRGHPHRDEGANPKTSISLAGPNAWSSSGRGRLSFDDWDYELPDAGARPRSESGALQPSFDRIQAAHQAVPSRSDALERLQPT